MRWAPLIVWLVPVAAWADEWVTVVESPPWTVKNRNRPDSAVKEILVEGDMEAPVVDIQTTLLTPKLFHKFMPNTKAAREIGKPEPDGSFFVYTETQLPVIQSRDFIVQVWNDELATAEGGTFKQHWKAAPKKLPERSELVRMQQNDGSWHITPSGNGSKSHVVHQFTIDPGGMLPSFAVDLGNKKGVIESLAAVEKEAQRRRDDRLKAEGERPRSSATPQAAREGAAEPDQKAGQQAASSAGAAPAK